MKQRPTGRPSSEKIIRDIKRNTRKQYSAEEKIRIVLDGWRGEDSICGAVPTRRPDTTIRIFSSAVYCLRVLRRISRTVLSAGSFLRIDFCLIFVPFGYYDEPEILRYAITSIYPKGADVRHAQIFGLPGTPSRLPNDPLAWAFRCSNRLTTGEPKAADSE